MNKRSFKYLLYGMLATFHLVFVGCAQVSPYKDGTIADIEYRALKDTSNEIGFVITVDDVIERYDRYLEIAGDDPWALAAAQRMATLRMENQEAVLLSDVEDPEVDEEELRLSIEQYNRILEQDPDNYNNHEVLYQLAKANGLIGDIENQELALSRLVKDHPDSRYYLDSSFKLGDLLYAQARYVEAEEAFGRVVAQGIDDNRYFLNAGYMQAWSQFKQSRYDDALMSFANVIDAGFPSQEDADAATGVNAEILNDSVYTMAVIFSYQGEWTDIGPFFDDYGERYYEYMIYDRLSDFYYEQKFYESAASTLSAYVERFPFSKHSPSFYEKAIEGFDTAGYPLRKREYETEYIERFGIDSQYWAAQPELHDQLKVSLAKYSLDLAKFNHGMAQQSKKAGEKNDRYQAALKWYDIYVRTYPDAEDAAEANFLLAEIAYELGDYKKSRDHYRPVAFGYEGNEYASDAAYGMILSYQKYQPIDELEAQEWQQSGADDSLRFVETYPDHPESGRILVSTAEMYFGANNYEEAVKVARSAKDIKEKLSDKHNYGVALVQGNSAYELGYFTEAEEALTEALQYKDIDRKTKNEITEKIAAAIYKQGEEAKLAGDYQAAARNWKRIAEVAPGSANSIAAEFDAATLLLETEDYSGAELALMDLQKKYPDHEYSADIPNKLIFAYEQQEKWPEAANALNKVCRNEEDLETRRVACWQAGENYEKAGDVESAIKRFKNYAHNYKEPFDLSVEAHNKMNKLYDSIGEQDKRKYWLEKIVELNSNADIPSERSKYLAAEALYDLGEFARNNYESIELTLPLNESIPVKNQAMQEAQDLYTKSVEVGVLDYTTSSTYRIGQLYVQLGQALMNSERPDGLDELEAEEYQFLLEDQAYPFEQAAIQVHETNINRTYDGVYDDWVKRSFEELGQLLPTQYRKKEKAVSYVIEIR